MSSIYLCSPRSNTSRCFLSSALSLPVLLIILLVYAHMLHEKSDEALVYPRDIKTHWRPSQGGGRVFAKEYLGGNVHRRRDADFASTLRQPKVSQITTVNENVYTRPRVTHGRDLGFATLLQKSLSFLRTG